MLFGAQSEAKVKFNVVGVCGVCLNTDTDELRECVSKMKVDAKAFVEWNGDGGLFAQVVTYTESNGHRSPSWFEVGAETEVG